MRLFDLRSLILFVLTTLFSLNLAADCPPTLPCKGSIQISLGAYCTAEIYPGLMLSSVPDNCDLQVNIYSEHDALIATTDVSGSSYVYPVIDASYIGKPWKATVFYVDDQSQAINCWGWFTVEDKIAPSLTCIEDFTVSCKDDLADLMTSSSVVRYCNDTAVMPVNNGDSTATYKLTGDLPMNPWEIVTNISTSYNMACIPAGDFPGSGGFGTGSGTGSGTAFFTVGTAEYIIPCIDGLLSFDALDGIAASEFPECIYLTLPDESLPDPPNLSFCFNITTESFATFNPDNCAGSDTGAEVVIISDELDRNECGDESFVAKRRIRYLIRDGVGLTSSTCEFDIHYAPESLDSLVFPVDYYSLCQDHVGNDPIQTGSPTINGAPIEVDNLCKLNVSYEDEFITGGATGNSACTSNFTIRRKWVILDWCLGEYRQHFQSITVVDNEVPVCILGDDFTVDTNNGCTADLIITPFVENSDTYIILDDFGCSAVSITKIEYSPVEDDFDSFANTANAIGNNTYRASGLGLGDNWLRYTISDACGNLNECRVEVTVVDNNPPVPVCDQYTAVSLATNGWGRIFGVSLDDGSYMPCGGEVDLHVRRMSNACNAASLERDDTVFGEYVQFCCAESGATVPVEMKIFDISNPTTYSLCTVNVLVQDKNSDAALTCPSPAIISVTECDTTNIASRFGAPNLSGDCALPEILTVQTIRDIDSDCGTGSVTRTWIIGVNGDSNGIGNCIQTIELVGTDALSQNSFVFPADANNVGCDEYTTDLGDFPTYRGVKVTDADLCARLAYSFSDNSFTNVDDFCVKTIRTWTIINWCVYDPITNPNRGIWTDTQILKVSNDVGPTITGCPEDITVQVDEVDCSANINLPMPSGIDPCFGEDLPASAFAWSISGTGYSENGVGPAGAQEVPAGSYNVTWTVTSLCNATSTCSYTVMISDESIPVPYCRSVVTTVITAVGPSGFPSVEIWASDFDLGTEDGCGGTVTASFSENNVSDTRRVFDCNQLGFQTLEIWFTDSDGNSEFCTSNINVQVNGTICDNIGSLIIIEGDIFTEESQMVEDVKVELVAMSTSAVNVDNTDTNGHFAFPNMTAGSDYRLVPEGNSDYLNGISTLDLVMIQRHILGIDFLDSPYKLIAADINNSQNINGIDLVELRKLILGIYTELPQNESWRFVDENFSFSNPASPWPFNEDIDLSQVGQNMLDNDFVAVKIGDINADAVVSFASDQVSSSKKSIGILNDVLSLNNVDEYLVPVYFDVDANIFGMQIALELSKDVELVGVEKGKLSVSENNTSYINNVLSISVANDKLLQVEKNEALFYLTLKSNNSLPNELFTINNSALGAETYSEDYAVSKIKMAYSNELDVEPILYQNVPNPFSGQTTIQFDIPTASVVTLKIIDLNGKLLKKIDNYYDAGSHTVELGTTELNGNGVYYYQMECGGFIATRKMIRVD